jgi:cytochrome b561
LTIEQAILGKLKANMLLRNTNSKWGLVSVFVHWISALVVIGLFVLGLWMVDLTYYDEWYRTAPALHKSIGIILFILTVLRLVWRNVNKVPEPIKNHTKLEIGTSRFAHGGLYFLMIAVMTTGYLISTADARPVDVFGIFKVPAIIHSFDKQEDIAGEAHLILASVLIGFSLFHGMAAIKHHVFNKDRTLKRMFGL